MNKPPVAPEAVQKALAQQKSDFTAEGSPPPGLVSTADPVGPPKPKKAAPTHRPPRRTITLKRAATPPG